jgi:hypothetical protein
MTLHFHWLHAQRWLAHAHVSRAVTLVLSVIGISLLSSALRVLDAAVSGALIDYRAAAVAPAASGASNAPDAILDTGPASVDASLVEVPEATVQAISL